MRSYPDQAKCAILSESSCAVQKSIALSKKRRGDSLSCHTGAAMREATTSRGVKSLVHVCETLADGSLKSRPSQSLFLSISHRFRGRIAITSAFQLRLESTALWTIIRLPLDYLVTSVEKTEICDACRCPPWLHRIGTRRGHSERLHAWAVAIARKINHSCRCSSTRRPRRALIGSRATAAALALCRKFPPHCFPLQTSSHLSSVPLTCCHVCGLRWRWANMPPCNSTCVQ